MKSYQPRSHYFRRLKFRILWRRPHVRDKNGNRALGTCDPPEVRKRAIEIDPKLTGLDKLQVVIDESLHACVWDIDNDSVEECALAIAAFLWRCGLRWEQEND